MNSMLLCSVPPFSDEAGERVRARGAGARPEAKQWRRGRQKLQVVHEIAAVARGIVSGAACWLTVRRGYWPTMAHAWGETD